MPDYSRGKIYIIRSYQTDQVYIGSTIQPLSNRMVTHRGMYKSYKLGGTNYTSSFEVIQFYDAYIELVENYPCNSNEELHRREGQLIRETENCCNKNIAGRTKEEYYGVPENKEKMKEYQKAYRLKPERIQIRKAYNNTQVQKDKVKLYHKRPEVIQRRKDIYKAKGYKYHQAYNQRPEVRARIRKRLAENRNVVEVEV